MLPLLDTQLNNVLSGKLVKTQKRQHKVIFLHDDAPSYTAKPVRDTSEALGWDVLLHAAYSPDLAPSDYHLLSSILVRTKM